MERHDSGFWRKRIAEQQRGGMSAAEYCRKHELSRGTFLRWRQRLERAPGEPELVEVRRQPLMEGSDNQSHRSLDIRLSNGVQIRFHDIPDPRTISEIVSAVRDAT